MKCSESGSMSNAELWKSRLFIVAMSLFLGARLVSSVESATMFKGSAGLLRIVSAHMEAEGTVRLVLLGEMHTGRARSTVFDKRQDYVVGGGYLSATYTPSRVLELYGTLPIRYHYGWPVGPNNTGALRERGFGDTQVGMKVGFPFIYPFNWAAEGFVTFPTGNKEMPTGMARSEQFSNDAYQYGARLLATLDLQNTASRVPLQFHANAGYLVNEATPLYGDDNWNDLLLLGIGLELSLGRVTPFFELTTEQAVNDKSLNFGKNPIRMSPGVRIATGTGIVIDAGLEIGLSECLDSEDEYVMTGQFTAGERLTRKWNAVLGITYSLPLGVAASARPIGTILGMVTDVRTGDPVEAAVSLPGTGHDGARTEPSRGTYMCSVPAGTYLIHASADGYYWKEKRVAVRAGGVISCDFSLRKKHNPVETTEETRSATEERTVLSEMLITNIFYETDIREVLRDISVQAEIPIVVDATVQGFVTLEVEDLPLEECLRRVLAPGGFTFKRMHGYYLVGAAYPDNPSFPLLSTTERIKPNYLKAAQVPTLLSTFYEPFLKIDEETNTIVVTASPEIIERIEEDLAEVDVPPKQVMIEALVTEFSKEAKRKLGLDWRVIGSGPDYAFSLVSLLTDRADSTLMLALTRTGAEYHRLRYDLWTTLQVLAEEGEVRVHANPRVVTLDGQAANIFLGKEEYYSIITGPVTYPYARLEMIKVGITLKIRPYVAGNGDITVEIEPEVSNVAGTGVTELPVVSKRSVSTKVRVKDGETITIGGLLQKSERETVVKIPLLGDIPFLGYLFRTTRTVVDETEAVVFITPHILRD